MKESSQISVNTPEEMLILTACFDAQTGMLTSNQKLTKYQKQSRPQVPFEHQDSKGLGQACHPPVDGRSILLLSHHKSILVHL